MKHWILAVAVAATAWPTIAWSDPACTVITRQTLVPCARAQSLTVRIGREELAAARGRRDAVAPWLPSNPQLGGTLGRREALGAEPAVANWSVSLSQELELAGQRGARVHAAEAEVTAQEHTVEARTRDALTAAWTAYFDALAAREAGSLARELLSNTEAFVRAADARVEKGLTAPVDATVARASAARTLQEGLSAERASFAARAQLGAWLGLPDAPTVAGELTPIAVPEMAMPVPAARPEIRAAEAESRAQAARADAFRRQRVPNPTLSVFVTSQEFNTRVFGVGLSVPIPLPHPLGRTYAGEIDEAEALSRRSRLDADRLRRETNRELVAARQALASYRAALLAFAPETVAAARASLRAIGDEVTAGRISVREAVVTQQVLIEFLRADVEARRDLCIASVDLVRAAGLPLEENIR